MDSALLLFLSKFNTRNTEAYEYTGTLPNGAPICVEGFQTNDAPCHFLMRWAAASGDKITQILCITSQEDTMPAYPGGPTSEEYFRATVVKALREDPVLQAHYGTEDIQILTIPYDYGENMETADPQLRAKSLYRCINDQLAGAAKRLYIDYTGGPRDTTFLITELARFLEYNGISCGCIAYSNLQEKRLVVLNSVYDMFRLLNAIHDFVSYGRAESLQSIYQHRNNPVVDHLLSSLSRFSQAMSLCALDNIDEILTEIREAVAEMEAYIPTADDDVAVRMLKDFLPQICEKFKLTQKGASTAELDLIDWCLCNGRLQQALILFTEKVPEICFRAGILEESLIDKGFLSGQGKSPWVYGMYDNLFRQLRSKDDVGEFRQYLMQVQQTKQEMKLSYPKALRICAEAEDWSPACAQAIARFVETVSQCFSAKDGTPTEQSQTCRFYGKGMTGKNIATFIKNVLEDEQILHCLVYQDEEAWKATQKQESRDLLKKMGALNFLKANPTTDVSAYTKVLSGQQLHTLLGGYFAVKMLRNHASHASGSDAPEIRYCFEQGLIDEPCVNYNTVRNALIRMNRFLFDLVIQ
jgi:hypothetical protein